MSKFDELKKAAQAAIEREDCDRFIERDDAQAVLELLAIQAQLVGALKVSEDYLLAVCINTTNPKKRNNYADALAVIRDAIESTGEQP